MRKEKGVFKVNKIKHILGCISGIGALIAAYTGHLYLLIILSLVTCYVCWTHIDFVRTTVDGIIKRALVFSASYLISSFSAEFFEISKQLLMWVMCDVAFLLMNITSLIIVLDKDSY